MVWIITLTAKDVALYRVLRTSIECLVASPINSIVNSHVPVLEELQARGSAEHNPGETIFVLVDQPGDVLKPTPENLRDRRINATLLDSLEHQLLGSRRFRAVIRDTPGRWGRKSMIRFYALEDSTYLHAWVDALNDVSANSVLLSAVKLIPQALLVESVYGEQMKSLTPVIFCQTFKGMVMRHTLFIQGLAMFTRVPAVAEKSGQQQAAQQLKETIDFLRSEKIVEAGVALRIALPPGSPTALVGTFSTVDAHCVVLQGKEPEADSEGVENCADGIHAQAGWLQQIAWESRRGRRELSHYDLNQSTRPFMVSAVEWVRSVAAYRLNRHGRVCLQVTPWMVLLLLVIAGVYAIRIHKIQRTIEINLAQIQERRLALERYRFRSPELEVLLHYKSWLARKPDYVSHMLQQIGLQLDERRELRLAEIYWCWSSADTDCGPDQFHAPEPDELTLSDNHAIPETLMLGIKGAVIEPFESRRRDFDFYQSWLQALVADEQLSVAFEEYSPHNQRTPHNPNQQSRSQTERAFSFVLRYQPLPGRE